MVSNQPEGVALHTIAPLTAEEPTDDRSLVFAFKRGEDGSYQAIYDQYSPRIAGICRRMLEHSHDAEEAQQETLMRVFTGLPNFNGRYQLGAWVSRIATNVCLDHIRSKGRKPADSTDQATLVDLSGDSVDSPEEIFMQGDERQRVRAVLSELAPMHRAALALREFEGMSYADIAVALGMTEPQVKALIHRARRSFKKRWAAHGLALLLPWRLLARIRRFSSHYDAPPHLADAAASTANFASSCSAALQQCGAFVTDKAAGAFTALIVGTAAVGVAVMPGAAPRPTDDAQHRRAAAVVERETVGEPKRSPKKRVRYQKKDVVSANPAPSDPEAEPAPAEESAPAPTGPAEPSEEPAEEKPQGGGGDGTPTGPPPTATYFGFQSDHAIPRADARSTVTRANCTNKTLHHEVDTLIAEGAFSYRMVMVLDASATTARFQFSVWKNNREVRYSTWGSEPSFAWATMGNSAQLEISGEFGALQGYDTSAANLPDSGTYDATLTLDCGAQDVVSEGAVFTAQ